MRIALLIFMLFAASARAATIAAASASQADVQTAVTAASDGDTVTIPDGSSTWTSGITTTKQIIIRALNYTATTNGTLSRNVTLTHNAGSSQLFNFTSGSSYHCGVGGIRFNEGTGTGNYVRMNGSGSKVGLMWDCTIENADRHGSSTDIACVSWLAQGGVLWNMYWLGIAAGSEDGIGPDSGAMVIKSPRAWNTASTMGTNDTSGGINVYIEDSTCTNAALFDIDQAGRLVIRYSTLDGCFIETHGFTSGAYNGGRHWEIYNCSVKMSSANRNMPRWFWCRAGTGIFTDLTISSAATPSEYGDLYWSIGDTSTPGTYPQDMQPGYGHDGANDVSDPIYCWNNSGARAYNYSFANGWDAIVVADRDVYVNNGAKPNYAKYTYPHPLRSQISGGGGGGGSSGNRSATVSGTFRAY